MAGLTQEIQDARDRATRAEKESSTPKGPQSAAEASYEQLSRQLQVNRVYCSDARGRAGRLLTDGLFFLFVWRVSCTRMCKGC